jgi:hypothetical protein
MVIVFYDVARQAFGLLLLLLLVIVFSDRILSHRLVALLLILFFLHMYPFAFDTLENETFRAIKLLFTLVWHKPYSILT